MPSRKLTHPDQGIDNLIREIRGQKVILDSDLAALYGVPTFRFNEAIKRNKNRFPPDFMFQLSQAEFEALRSQTAISEMEGAANSSQIAMSSRKHRGTAYRPYAFTEHGALQAANILRSQRAVQMSFAAREF
jgi:ORF6N domain